MKSRNVRIIAKGMVSIGLLTLLYYKVDWPRMIAVLDRVDIYPVGLTVIINALGVFLSVLKWRCLLRVQTIYEPLSRLHALYYMGFFFSNFLPSMVGGDLFRILKTSTQEQKHTQATSAVLAERTTGLAAMLLLAASAASLNLWRNVSVGMAWLAWCVLGVIVSSLLAWLLLARLERTVSVMPKVWDHLGLLLRLRRALTAFYHSPGVLAKALLFSVVFHVLLVTNGYLFGKSIGLNLDFISLAVIFPVAMLAGMIPVSLNGLGITEGALIVLLGQIEVVPEEALIIAVLSRFFVIVASVLGGVLFALDRSRLTSALGTSMDRQELSDSPLKL